MQSYTLKIKKQVVLPVVFWMCILLTSTHAAGQLGLNGATSVYPNTSATYTPTFNGSSTYPYSGPYSYSIVGGVVTGTSNTIKSGNNSGVLYNMPISVTWGANPVSLSISCNLGFKTINITKIGPLTAGTLSPSSQTINYNTAPSSINGTGASGGAASPSYSYQWMSSSDGVNWANITGATSINYSPGVLIATTYFRRKVTETTTMTIAYTSAATVTVYPPLLTTINPSSQTINYGDPAPALTAIAHGGSGTYTFEWFSSTDNATWTSRATTKTYSPGILSVTTYFRFVVTSNGAAKTSDPVQITVSYVPTVTLQVTSTTPSGLGTINVLTSLASGGNGPYSYVWYQSINQGASYQIVTGATQPSYTTPVITSTIWYYVAVTSGSYTGQSNIISFGIPNPPTITTDDDILCNGAAATLTASGTSGTIKWYNANNTQVGTGTTFTTQLAGTYHATASSTYGTSTSSNTVTITTPGAPVAGSILGSSICVLGSTAQLANAVSGGTWSSSNANIVKVFNDGLITGKAAGTATITYTVNNGCGITSQQLGVTVVPFSDYSDSLGRGIDDPIITDTISLVANAVKATEFQQDTLYSAAHTIQNVIAFRVLEETQKYIPGDFTATAVVKIEYGHSPSEIYQIDSTHLIVTYTKGANSPYNAIKYLTLNNAEYTRVTVIRVEAPMTVNGVNFDTKQILLLTNSLIGQRYYQLANNKIPTLSYTTPASGIVPDALAVTWIYPEHTNNNFTQLEWAWLEDEMRGSYIKGNAIDTTLLFKTGATRVDLPGGAAIGSYNIPLLYSGTGKLYMRVRAINVMPSGSSSSGSWSAVKTFAFTGHDSTLNWQAITTYAEEGKRKTVVQYFDGSLRPRQTVTKDNTTETTVIAETFYDGQGRPAVQVLPSPGINNIIAYTKNLNKFNGQSDNTDPLDYFDFTTVSTGRYATAPLSETSGSAQYYSSQNPELNAAPSNKNIPAANGYPYTVTRYTPDATGRIMMQSGVGDSMQMGSGHATRYYYGSASQEELDALFGTEAGNYTHYFKNMVQDANEQMSVSYVDMHGRTIATALAGEAPESLQALDISATGQYKNQEGTTLTRNLLDSNTNVLKGDAIESVNTLLVPFRTQYAFSYELPVRTVQLPDCNGGTVSYTCKYDLQIAISEESGDTASIVFNYPGIGSINFQQSVTLPPGSYSIRKTLTINPDSLAAFIQQYNTVGVGLCRTQQFLIDSIAAQDSLASNCGVAATPLTCSSCLSSLGSYSAYLLNYANSIGLSTTAQLSNTQKADIRNQYVADSTFCASLNAGTSRYLDNIKKQMLADMVPYSGQYARKDGVNQSMFYKYDIFSGSGNPNYTQPFYKYPRNRSLQNDNYYDTFGRIDSSVLAPQRSLMTKEDFQQAFEASWAASLLPYHPEFPKLKFAEDSLRKAYDFIDSVNQTVAIAFNPVASDPFFTFQSPGADKDSMIKFSDSTWHGSYSMWQMAYGEAFGCKTNVDTTDRKTCYNNMPKQLATIGTSVNTGAGSVTLTAGIQQQAWNMYKAFYSQARSEMVNKYINVKTNAADNDNLISQGYRLYFPDDNVQQAENLDWTAWFPRADGSLPTVNLADSVEKYSSPCDSYINSWRVALLQCPSLPVDSATREQIIASITSRMAEVCAKGTDGANPYGASTVAPAYADDTFTSFEEVVYHVFDSLGISRDLYCHPYDIQFPKPYGRSPIVTQQFVTAVDTCTCSQFDKLKTEVANAGFNSTSLSSINQYLLSTYQDTISTVLYEGLQRCGLVYLTNCNTVSIDTICWDPHHLESQPCTISTTTCDTLTALPLASPQPLPFFLTCGFSGPSNSCFSCANFKSLDSSFYALFGQHPVFNGTIANDTVLNYNILFAKYINFKTGLQHDWRYYADRFAATECGIGGLTGTSNASTICLDRTPLNDTTGFVETISPCKQARDRAAVKAALMYDAYQQQLMTAFRQAYLNECLNAGELFSVVYTVKEYHYTLYYYDQAGNLVKTVPPKGVIPIFRQSFLDSVELARSNGTLLTPQHELVTRYCYNSLNQVNIQKTPDGGTSRFWYDRLGRLAVSQNARQLGQGNVYSYTQYDVLGRITEVGQLTGGSAMSDATARNAANLSAWFTSATSTRTQITATVYDEAYPAINGVVLSQQHLRNRVSYTQVINNASDTYPASGTYYSYDVHGNVDTLLQDFGNSTGVANMMNNSGNRFKRVVYDYDLISGKVNAVAYQPGYLDVALQTWVSPVDRYYQRYVYDADNRLTDVYSGKDSVILLLFPEREAHYSYYKHGPLARTELGQLKVQGLDYVYTLQGWLKGINPVRGGTLANGTDTTEAYPTARDAYGFSLHYYKNDYTAIGYTSAAGSVLDALPGNGSPLFNGNIAAMAVNLPNMGGVKVYGYQYDQLNRLVAMDAYDGLSPVAGTFTPIQLNDYRERVSYDPNGNILTYQRNGDAARLNMDNLSYFYTPNTNRLHKVSDAAADAGTGTYNDIRQGQNDNNYAYDAIGNLIKDEAEGISNINWNVYGKISSISKSAGTIRYSYDAQGNRVMKQSGRDTTAYVRDASGNVLAVYTHRSDVGVVQVERHLYGSSRLGVAGYSAAVDTLTVLSGGFGNAIKSTFTRGQKLFELTNHLGNVLATVSDKRLQVDKNTDGNVDDYAPDVLTANDYYPFGMLMPGRSGHQGAGGSGWINGGGASSSDQGLPESLQLDDPRSGNTPAAYVATDHIDIIPDFESQPGDEFVIYIDNTSSSGGSGGSSGSGSSGSGGASNGYYRYGFNGKENDNDVKGTSNQQDYGERMYDSRLGRFLSIDPLARSFPYYTPYQYAGNNPILFIDIDGLEQITPQQFRNTVAWLVPNKPMYIGNFRRIHYELFAKRIYYGEGSLNKSEQNILRGAVGEVVFAGRATLGFLPYFGTMYSFNKGQSASSPLRHDVKLTLTPVPISQKPGEKGVPIPGGGRITWDPAIPFANADGSTYNYIADKKSQTTLYVEVKTLGINSFNFANLIDGFDQAIRTAGALKGQKNSLSVLAVDAGAYMNAVRDPAQRGILIEKLSELRAAGGQMMLINNQASRTDQEIEDATIKAKEDASKNNRRSN